MPSLFQMPSWGAKNPLGIVALFISLIYGMSAALLGSTVRSLSAENQTTLVDFIVVFPVLVLGVFAWLVAQHHTKLYGPGDFRTDEAFLGGHIAHPAELGARLNAQVQQDIPEDWGSSTGTAEPQVTPLYGTIETTKVVGENRPSRIDSMARVYLVHGLVLQELHTEFGGVMQREVSFSSATGKDMIGDGVIKTQSATYIIEIKIVNKARSLRNNIIEGAGRLALLFAAARKDSGLRVRAILAIALDFPKEAKKSLPTLDRYVDGIGVPIVTRVYWLPDLLEKYGFSPKS